MASTNYDRVTKALDLLKSGLYPYFERELKNAYASRWTDSIRRYIQDSRSFDKKGNINWDIYNVLLVMWEQWNDVFKKTLGQSERTLVSELRDTRNQWAHQKPFSTDDTYRALDSISRLLDAVSAPETEEIEKMKMELLRLRFDEQRRSEQKKAAVAPVEGKPKGNLKPWREIITPHKDVASGKYQQAEFAADLWQVFLGEGSSEYKDPVEFFRRTYLTDGLKDLLTNSLQRLSGKGGDPVVELQTNFGGGKTHSLLALYHLYSGKLATELSGIEELTKPLGLNVVKGVRKAIFVGTKVSPGQVHKKPDKVTVKTLWGELAWQLGGKEGYDLIKDADQTATNPGDTFRELLNKYSPCLILIDEWVAYARQLHENPDLPAGTFATQFTFAQTLTEAVKCADRALLVISIPVSQNEVGGDMGKLALDQLRNAIGRVEASWRPASQDEGFEIVRRRLFEPIVDNQLFIQRDAVARAFSEMYATQSQEFPSNCREGEYERRIKSSYPIHPELFDHLYNDWSTLDKFQRTRGVLRLMATVIHSLWKRQDSNLLIMPATVPIDDPTVLNELTRYLEENWTPVIEQDVDGPHSLPLTLDGENPNLGRYSACRRVARTIYLGSAPLQRVANKGIDDRQVKLGCSQPGESTATFGDALRRLTDKATFLYVDGNRYWYSTQPTVARLADDRAQQLSEHDVEEEIRKRLREESRRRGEFSKVHVCVTCKDIPDETDSRLVILGPEFPHTAKDEKSPARNEVTTILESRGNSPRNNRNTLVFLAPDATRLQELSAAVRQYMAWMSIVHDREELNLDAFQGRQAETKRKNADETVKVRIPETYQWLLVPIQNSPDGPIEWREIRLQGQDDLAVRASKKLKNEELLIPQMGGTVLRMWLDRIPLWRGDHVGVKQVAEDFSKYLYLPRLKDQDVLIMAIQEGISLLTWENDTFAYAEAWDDKKKEYRGLQAGKSIHIIVDNQSVIVKSEAAKIQFDKQKAETEKVVIPGKSSEVIGKKTDKIPPIVKKLPTRFHASVKLDPQRLGRDIEKIATEVVPHISKLINAEVEITLDIQAKIPGGANENIVRTVTENCKVLNFINYGFEEE